MLVKQEAVRLMKGYWSALQYGVSILCTPKAKLQRECQLRRSLYLQFLAVVIGLLATSIAATIFMRMPEVLLLSAAAIIAFLLYMGMTEMREMQGGYAYIQVLCIGKEKVMNAPRKPVFRYSFAESKDGPCLFSLDRTEELGFIEGMRYLFAFRADKDLPLGNESLLYSVSIPGDSAVVKPEESDEEQKARHDAALKQLRTDAAEEKDGKIIEFPPRERGPEEEGDV